MDRSSHPYNPDGNEERLQSRVVPVSTGASSGHVDIPAVYKGVLHSGFKGWIHSLIVFGNGAINSACTCASGKPFPKIVPMHSYFFLHIERSIWCFADMVTIFERFRECSKIVPLMVSQSSLLFSWLNFCRLAHTSTTEKRLENAALLLQ